MGETVETLLQQAEAERRGGRIDAAIGFAQRALDASAGSSLDTALAQLELGNLLRYVPETLRALQLLTASEGVLREKAHAKLPRVLTIRGMTLGDAGDHNGALELYREALHLLEKPDRPRDYLQEAASVGALGIACTQLGDFPQAEQAYLRSVELYERAGMRDSNAYVYNNLAILRVRSIEQGQGDRGALERDLVDFIGKGLAIAGSNPLPRALLLNTQGDGLRALGRLEEALPILGQALETYRGMNNPRGEIDAATDMAALLLELGRVNEALALLEDGRKRIGTMDLKDHERRLEELLAEAYERSGDAAAALRHFKRFHQLHRELQDLEAQRNLQRIALRADIDKAQRESREDALTGIPNRRRFEEVARATSSGARFAVAVFDIDHFKKINDRLSHAMGDEVLREVGRLLRAHCRESDFVARIGGEEFVHILQGASAEDARLSCERLRAAIERHDYWKALDPELAVTISIGIAAGDGRSSLLDLMKTADARLYEAKRAGRNRVVAA